VTARITWRVVRYDDPSPAQNPSYRGGPDVLAVPGDTIRVFTPDGAIDGEPFDVLLSDNRAFWLLAAGGEMYRVSHRTLARLEVDE
jgi:hypothetical protein